MQTPTRPPVDSSGDRPTLTRREMFRRVGAAAGAATLWSCATRTPEASHGLAPPRPNIIVIMADDLGWSDIGCYGGEIDTPHIDRLAHQGIRFTHFYNNARCCPTRASLLTGLYPHQTGIGHMTDPEFDYGRPGYRGALNRNCVTLGEALKAAGYHTLMSGKWHVGRQAGMWPSDRGFDEFYGILHGASNFFEMNEDANLARNRELLPAPPAPYYTTDAFTDYAVQFIRDYAAKDHQPYFLYMSYTAPHFPLQAWPDDIAKYRGRYRIGWDEVRRRRLERQQALGIVPHDCPLTPRDPEVPAWEDAVDPEAWDLRMAVYAAMVDSMDRGIGRILDAVRKTGQEDNTLVIFLSDNGAASEPIELRPGVPPGPAHSFSGYYAPWANASNTPFRRYKHWAHEGGILTPCVVKWPAVIRDPGSITDQTGHVMDFMATFLEAAGGAYPDTHHGNAIHPLEGKSLMPIFCGRRRDGYEALFWEHEGNRAVRMGHRKLVSEFSNYGTYLDWEKDVTRYPNQWELYDLAADRMELNNLAGDHPEEVREMAARYDAWAKRCFVEPWEEILPAFLENARKKREGLL